MLVHFAVNESSWDRNAERVRPHSMCDLINRPVQYELTARGIPWTVGREPVDNAINLYGASRSVFTYRPARETAVLMSHGIASKGIRARLCHDFHYALAPSLAHRDEMTRTGYPKWRAPIVGYTKLDWLLNPKLRRTLTAPTRDDRIRVLYAPTHGGGGEQFTDPNTPTESKATLRTTWWRRDEILTQLDPDVFDVVECWHPRYTPGNKATLEQYLNADVVIADGGSTLWEALALRIPVITPEWLLDEGLRRARNLEGVYYRSGDGYRATTPTELPVIVEHAAKQGHTRNLDQWADTACPPELRGHSAQAHADWIEQILTTTEPTREGLQRTLVP